MSSPNFSILLTPLAQTDYEDILSYTEQEWGEQQRDKYDGLLLKALSTLESDPRRGRANKKLPAGYLIYHVGRHLIVYRLEGLESIVLRILHERMDLPRHIP